MNLKSLPMKEHGIIAVAVIVFLFIFSALLYPYVFRQTPPPQEIVASDYYCRDMTKNPNPPTVQAPSYSATAVETGNMRTYKLIKERVPMNHSLYGNVEGHHFFPGYEERYTDPLTGKRYLMRIPNGEQGRTYKLPSEVGTEDYLTFAEYGLLYLFPADDEWKPVIFDQMPIDGGGSINIAVPDIYKAVDLPDLPEWVLKCIDAGTNGTTQGVVYDRRGFAIPPQKKSEISNELQLEWFLMTNYKLLLNAWWTPHCKPAVYLYPPYQMRVNVKVFPEGFLIYTDPQYDAATGWNVEANPDGTIVTGSGRLYPYLYFESKVRDEVIDIPEAGWVIQSKVNKVIEETKEAEDWFLPLEEHFNETLPKLGLNKIQTKDFIEYWKKALPYSPYYFVGVIEQENVDRIERLEITPKPDYIKRVRIYFERLDQPRPVQNPALTEQAGVEMQDSKFAVVEWGGMVKNDPNHPFTCSQ